MAYEFVCESEAKRYCSDCSRTLKKTCELLRTKGISAQFSLVGSGARNMITRNGDGPYDLDYNLLIMKAEERYWNDLRLLKETVRNALNRAERREFFSDAQDSTSCLTALLHFKDTPNVEFSFDVAITTKNKNGNYISSNSDSDIASSLFASAIRFCVLSILDFSSSHAREMKFGLLSKRAYTNPLLSCKSPKSRGNRFL